MREGTILDVHDRERTGEATLAGKVLITGIGYLIVATMWGLLAYFQRRDGDMSVTTIDAALSAAHLVVGVLILARLRVAIYLGIVVAGVSIGLTVLNRYYLPVFTDGVLAVLTYLIRNDLATRQERAGPLSGSRR
jgi:hypothetical protein